MKKRKRCSNCGRTPVGGGIDEDPADNELFCYFCEMTLVKFGKKEKKQEKSRKNSDGDKIP